MESYSLHSEAVRKLVALVRKDSLSARPYRGPKRSERMYIPGGGANASPAVTTVVIPARSGTTPGGPVSVTKLVKDPTSGDLVDGDSVEIFSWVKTDSADPANEDGGRLHIWIEEDEAGVWWFTAQDCTKPPITEVCADLSADTLITTTLAGLPGTTLTFPTDGASFGWYTYELRALIRIANVQGNQAWDVSLGLYDITDSVWLLSWDFAGTGTPVNDINLSRSTQFELDSGNAGHQIALGAVRQTTTGDVTALQLDSLSNQATRHCYRGPM